jgi:putative endonuclease
MRMIRGIRSAGPREWSVYVLRCGDGSLYTGITKDIPARLLKHSAGKGAAYTRTHLPVQLVYQECKLTRSGALIREAAVKRLSRQRKEQLILLPSSSAALLNRHSPRTLAENPSAVIKAMMDPRLTTAEDDKESRRRG